MACRVHEPNAGSTLNFGGLGTRLRLIWTLLVSMWPVHTYLPCGFIIPAPACVAHIHMHEPHARSMRNLDSYSLNLAVTSPLRFHDPCSYFPLEVR